MSYKPKSGKGLKGGLNYKTPYTGQHPQSKRSTVSVNMMGKVRGGLGSPGRLHRGKVGLKRG
jgi:hypothetical protein